MSRVEDSSQSPTCFMSHAFLAGGKGQVWAQEASVAPKRSWRLDEVRARWTLENSSFHDWRENRRQRPGLILLQLPEIPITSVFGIW